MDSSHPGGIGGTFGGNPVAAAAAIAVLKQIEDGGVLEKAQHIESVMMARLSEMKDKYPVIGEIRGRGAMIAIEFVKPGTRVPNATAVDAVVKHAHTNGVVILNAGTYGNVVRFLPSLAISDALIHDALDVVEAGIANL
jgi:4-aminobutyrate aminotransferase/(S)-3-amino-2-methylpropionate transaminase